MKLFFQIQFFVLSIFQINNSEANCISKLRLEAKKQIQEGYDLLTNDYGISNESLATMTITKDLKENTYSVVYYLYPKPSAMSNTTKKQVKLKLTVTKEGMSYKISSVK